MVYCQAVLAASIYFIEPGSIHLVRTLHDLNLVLLKFVYAFRIAALHLGGLA